MGVRILVGEYDGGDEKACLVDSVTGTAFGPLFEDRDEAQDFCDWCDADPRGIDAASLHDLVLGFRAQRAAQDNEDRAAGDNASYDATRGEPGEPT